MKAKQYLGLWLKSPLPWYSLTGKGSDDIFSQFSVKLKTLNFVVENLSLLSAIAAPIANETIAHLRAYNFNN